MSPAQPPEDLLKRLVEDLVFLFEELLPVVQTQIDNEKALGERVQFAANEVSDQTGLPARLFSY